MRYIVCGFGATRNSGEIITAYEDGQEEKKREEK